MLDIANSRTDPGAQIQFVAAFALSNYSSTIGRTGKPFNPLLGETYEYISRDGEFRYLAEQVSHHPVRLSHTFKYQLLLTSIKANISLSLRVR